MNYTLINYKDSYTWHDRCGDWHTDAGTFSITYPENIAEITKELIQLFVIDEEFEPLVLVDGREYTKLDWDNETEMELYREIEETFTKARIAAKKERQDKIERDRLAAIQKEAERHAAAVEAQRQKDLKQLAELQARYANEVK